MKLVMMLLLFGAQILSSSGYGSAKEGRCPRPKGNISCDLRRPSPLCFMDLDCRGTQKCCDDGCGGNTCKAAILPPRPVQGVCRNDPAVLQTNKQNPNCQRKRTKFCYKTNCKRCCKSKTTCNPNPNLYTSVEACTKVLCAKKTCNLQGEKCVMHKRYNTPRCVCPSRSDCPRPAKNETVCGTDKITYKSTCEMDMTACVLGDIIDVEYRGECRRRPENKIRISPSHVKKQVLQAGKRGKITCQFEGDPVQIIWDKVGMERLPPNRMLPQDNVLVINSVILRDAGIYMCSAFDGAVSIGASVNVSVKEPKIITSKAIKPRSVCLQDKLIGTGTKYVVRFFFNSASRVCEPFVYSGSGGNANNFGNKESCIRACSHSATEVCSLPKRPGPCFARFQRWYYDRTTAKCKMFVYGGCRGNANNFDNKKSCLQKCSAKHVCSLPKAVGSCHGHTARYFYDTASKTCKKFIYTGCEGNANQFHSLKHCRRKCMRKVRPLGMKRKVKRGICPAPIFEVRSCSDHNRDSCISDSDCKGKAKCCFNGCHRKCLAPLQRHRTGRRFKLGQCPRPRFSGKVCARRFGGSVCQTDRECPGRYKCCHNGCFFDCSLPEKIPKGRPKPGNCPTVNDPSGPRNCKKTTDECSSDNDCFGRQKCCYNSCHRECMDVRIFKPKPGQCPIQDAIELEDCSDTKNTCSLDQQCSGTSKCCFTGCKMECLKPPGIKPGVCPKPWKGLNGICDFRGDMCRRDFDCKKKDAKCCFNGCQNDCLSPGDRAEEKSKKSQGKCPMPWKNTRYCDRMGDRCSVDQDCYGNFRCCFNGCQKDCVKPVNLTKCQEAKQRAMDLLSDELPPIGVFVPSCKADGSYERVQCSGSIGYCWCVDKNGVEIQGTRIRGEPNCTTPVKLTKCQKAKQKASKLLSNELPMVGVFVPSCKADGSFESVQCSGSIGYCWCVDKNGVEIQGTSIRGEPNCTTPVVSRERQGKCPKPWKGKLGFCDFRGDECDKDSQCPFTQKCCYNGCQRDCLYPEGTSPCQKHLRSSTLLGGVGKFTPKCRADGFYERVQCSGSTGYCWCVDNYGNELPRTQVRGRPNCNNPGDVAGEGVAGTCPQPSKGKDGICDRMGDECSTDSTCSGPNQKCCFNGCQRQCLDAVPLPTEKILTLCQKNLKEARGPFDAPPPGTFVPSCKADGSFNETQCHTSVGDCWCVNSKTGEEVVTTRVSVRGGGGRDCSNAGLTKCQKHFRDSLELPPIGRFQPSCEDSGKYESMQCHGSTGYCWCVDDDGNELLETRVRGRPDCKPRLNPCAGVTCPYYGICTVSGRSSTSCLCNKFCHFEFLPDPICGSDGKTYLNECAMKSSICSTKMMVTVKYKGKCPPASGTDCDPRIKCSHPLRKCIVNNSTSTCECPMVKCSGKRTPVCGTDNKTYQNECIMNVHACRNNMKLKVAHRGECKGVMSDPCSISLCSHPQHFCRNINNASVCKCRRFTTLEYDPKCATDGKTYPNRMSMENAGCEKNMILKVVKNGRCERIDKVGTCPEPWKGIDEKCSARGNTCEDDSSCEGTKKCCYNGCERECISVADYLTCEENCGAYKQCVGLGNGTTRCLCRKGQLTKGNICKTPEIFCKTATCPHPRQHCVVKRGTPTCECPPTVCAAVYKPVCGSDGKTYSNKCELEKRGCKQDKNITVVSKGPCRKDVVPSSLDICETTVCSHPLRKCVNKGGKATCECPLVNCTGPYDPVCVSDGLTYTNNCTLAKEACTTNQNVKFVSNGDCPFDFRPPRGCVTSICTHPLHVCREFDGEAICECPSAVTGDLNYVCGSDGVTYPNRATMEVEGCRTNRILKIANKGKCPRAMEDQSLTCPAPWTGLNGICNRRGSMCNNDTNCAGPLKCCFDGCQRDCVNVAANLRCDEDCGPNKQCVGFIDGSTRCLCKDGTVMGMDGSCTVEAMDPCEISLCSYPHTKCVSVNGNATCECPTAKDCTMEERPVCGTDRNTYSNRCALNLEACKPENVASLRLKHEGPCPPEMEDICKRTRCSHPMQKCVNKGGKATCECPLVACFALYAPVCGSDGKTYSNNCTLAAAGCEKSQIVKFVSNGQCPENIVSDPCSISLCSHPQHTCHNINNTAVCKCRMKMTMEHDPKCASDGKTYPNRMSMENAGCKKNMILKVVKNGRCEMDDDKPGTCPAPWTGLNGLCNRRGSMCNDDTQCPGVSRCCFNGCQKDCVKVADNLKCGKDCGPLKKCVGFPNGSTRCLCKEGTVMGRDGSCKEMKDICETTVCSHPLRRCVNKGGKATCECPLVNCTGPYDPVCVSDGFTYTNNCTLAKEACTTNQNVKFVSNGPCPSDFEAPSGCVISICTHPLHVCREFDGEAICECPSVITTDLNYVCGSDGVTYPNRASLEVEGCKTNRILKIASKGKCPTASSKPNKELNPCDITLCAFPTTTCVVVNKTATCECPKKCTDEYSPVCGSDGNTYENLCELASAACKPENKGLLKFAKHGRCPRRSLCASKNCTIPYSTCREFNGVAKCVCRRGCTREYKPVIGSDGKRYNNPCLLRVESCTSGKQITVVRREAIFLAGPLPPSSKPGKCPPVDPRPCPAIARPGGCTSDSECPGQSKCCSDGCVRRCGQTFMPPVGPPGGCPPARLKPCLNKHDRKEYCQTNANCPRGQKCCFDGCIKRCDFFRPLPPGSMPGGHHGRPPAGRSPSSKPGKCPPVDPRPCPAIARPGGCTSDSECPGQSKCCNDGCGRRCFQPFNPNRNTMRRGKHGRKPSGK